MFGTKSGASDFEYKVGEVNIAPTWNPKEVDPAKMGGFNFSTEESIIRWLVRGDTLYDVEIPEDAEIVACPNPSTPHGVFRSNKIIVTNPRLVTDEMAMDLYHKSNLPEKTYFKTMAVCAMRGCINTALQIFADKIKPDNVEVAINEFETFCTKNGSENFDEEKHLGKYTKVIYDKMKEMSV